MVALVGNCVEAIELEEILGRAKEIDRGLYGLAQVLSK